MLPWSRVYTLQGVNSVGTKVLATPSTLLLLGKSLKLHSEPVTLYPVAV